MPSVTVLGVSSQVLTLTYDSAFNAGIATQLAAAITKGVLDTTIVPFNYPGTPPTLSPGQAGEMVIQADASATAPAGFANVVVAPTAVNATVVGSGDANERIL